MNVPSSQITLLTVNTGGPMGELHCLHYEHLALSSGVQPGTSEMEEGGVLEKKARKAP